MFGVFGIYFLYMMLAYLIKGTGTSRANLKDALYNFLFVYALLYAVPIAVDYLLLFRDGLLKVFTEKALSSAEDFSFVDAVLQQAADETRMLYSLLALCFVCGSVWIGFNYIKIALQQAYLFGIFPLVAFRSFSDKNILNKWFSYFFANALVPLFDCIGFNVCNWCVWDIKAQKSVNVIFFNRDFVKCGEYRLSCHWVLLGGFKGAAFCLFYSCSCSK